MQQADFEALVERIRKETTDLLVMKGREYAGSTDRLANFKRGAEMAGVSPLTILFIYMSKHYDALATYVKDRQAGGPPQKLSEPITSRLADLINYCTLAWALIEEEQQQKKTDLTLGADPAIKPPHPRRVRVRSTAGQTALLDGRTREEFHQALARRAPGTRLVFEGSIIEAWKFEDATDWTKL